jgi:hypothetical protein
MAPVKAKAKRKNVADLALARAQTIVVARPPPSNRVFMLLLVLIVLLLTSLILYTLGLLDWIKPDNGDTPPSGISDTSQSPITTTTPEPGSTAAATLPSGIGAVGIVVIVVSALLLLGIGILFLYQVNGRKFTVQWASKPALIVLFIIVVLTAILIESFTGLTALSNVFYFFALGIICYYIFVLFLRRSERYVADKQDEISLAAVEYMDDLAANTDVTRKAKDFMATVDIKTAQLNAMQLLEDKADGLLDTALSRSIEAEEFVNVLRSKGISDEHALKLNEITEKIKRLRGTTRNLWQQGQLKQLDGPKKRAMREYKQFVRGGNKSVAEANSMWEKVKHAVETRLNEDLAYQNRPHKPSGGLEKDAED